MAPHDPAFDEAEGRELADRLKREALEELPILLALWETPPSASVQSAA